MNIYVVMGTTGEYSDRYEWPVVAYNAEALAVEHVRLAGENARLAQASRGTRWSGMPKGWVNPWDRNMSMDYTGTSYYFITVAVATALPVMEG